MSGKNKLIPIVSLKNYFSLFCFSRGFFYLFAFQAADQGAQQ